MTANTVSNKPAHAGWDPLLLWILALALLVRWTLSHVLAGDLLAGTWEYEDVALNLLSSNGFVAYYRATPYLAFMSPFYPVLCAAVYWIVGHSSLVAMQVVQSAAVVPAGWMAFDLASKLAGRRAGLFAALGVTLHPALLIFSLRRHPLWLDAVIFLAVLWATFRIRRSAGTRRVAWVGVLFGIALLARSTLAPFMGIACLWLIRQWRAPLSQSVGRVAMIVAVALLIASPWLIRNAIVFGKPVGFISATGYNLWIGNNPATTGGALAADGRGMDLTNPALLASLAGLTELEQQEVYRRAAWEYIESHPWTAVRNYGLKLRSFLFWSPLTGAWYPGSFRTAYQAVYLALFVAALVGAYRLARAGQGAAVVLFVSFVLSIGLVQSVFFVEGRHRWQVESGLVVLAACGLGRIEPQRTPLGDGSR